VASDSTRAIAGVDDDVDARTLPASVGRRFAIFAATLSAANLFLPWDVVESARSGQHVLYWWHLLLDHALPDAVILQVLWMGVTPIVLLVAGLLGPLRHRGMLLLSAGTVGLVTQGWCMMVRWERTNIDLLDPAQLQIMVAVALVIGAGLAGSQLRLCAIRPDLRRQRWATGFLGLTQLLGLGLFAAMLAGSPGSLIDLLTPGGHEAISYGVMQSTAVLIYGAIGLGAVVSLLVPLTPPGFAASVAMLARRVIHLPILLTPFTVAFAAGGGGDEGGPIVQFFAARMAAMYAIYWFALTLGGEILLAVRYDAIEPEEEAF
jgi:hypothetical protein